MALMELRKYLSMIKFSHSIFALPFALIAFVEALPGSRFWNSGPQEGFYALLGKVILAMVLMRSGAMGFNRIVDRHIDAKNPRTKDREIPAGKVDLKSAWTFTILSLVLFVLVAFWINPLCGFLSPVAMLFTLGYSFSKRFTFLCHFLLGLSIGIAPAGAWIAVRERIELLPVLWSLALMFYIAGFDILYACMDIDFDRSSGIFSIPARFGAARALWVARLSHVISFSSMLYTGILSHSGLFFFLGTAVICGLFIQEHRLVRPGKFEKIPIAFFNINAWVSVVIFSALLLDRIYPLP